MRDPIANDPFLPPPLPAWAGPATERTMQCSNHPDQDGVGVCVVCKHTLCGECITEIAGLCRCKAGCQAAIETPEQQRSKLQEHLLGFRKIGESLAGQVFRTARWASGVLLLITGIALSSSSADAGLLGNALIAIGIIFLGVYGFIQWKIPRTLKR